MELFPKETNINILPNDGVVLYSPKFIEEAECKTYIEKLFNTIEWENEIINLFGKEIIMNRQIAFYADDEITYTYSKNQKIGKKWNEVLISLKNKVEAKTKINYNACLLNLYHDGTDGMGWHSDNEKEIIENSSIVSLSFGADRKFSFKNKKTKQTISLILENGSLLEMKENTQKNWLHALPKTKKIKNIRINLTFRQMKNENK
jgi:alkylated DNA repair dioxygenase AlkB